MPGLAYWDRLAAGLESDGADGFMRAFDPPADERWRESVLKFTRQRIERHLHPEALARARAGGAAVARHSTASNAWARSTCLPWWSEAATIPTPRIRWPWPRSTRERLPQGELVVEDAGRAAARLAGRAALARDPRLAQSYRTEPSLTIVAPS